MANNPFSASFEDALEQGVSQAKQQVSTTAKSVQSQVGVQPSSDQGAVLDSSQGEVDPFNETATKQNPQDPQKQAQMQQAKAKDQEDRQKKLVETRQKLQQLHKTTYFDLTFNPQREEPSLQERLEKEDQEKEQKKMEELHEEQKKETPVALQQAMNRTEIHRGASG